MKGLMAKPVSTRLVCALCALLLTASVLPMYVISFYNHPFYDDYGFTLRTRAAWIETGSVPAVLSAAVRNTVTIRSTWEGTYFTSFIGALQPGVFSEKLYFITTLLLLTTLLICLYYFLRQALCALLGAGAPEMNIAFCCLAFLCVQFVPDVSEAFFWFNGGTAYTLMFSLLLIAFGLMIRLDICQSRGRRMAVFALLCLLTALLGGAKYSTVLFMCVVYGLWALWALFKNRRVAAQHVILLLIAAACLLLSVRAPGNAVRAETLSIGMSAPKAVAQALYFGLSLMGNWFTLPVIAPLALLVPLLLPCLKKSAFAFKKPALVALVSAAAFCAQLAPTMYSGLYLGDGRVVDTYWYTYVLTVFLNAVYIAGWASKRVKSPPRPRVWAAVLAGCLMIAGCVGFRPEGAESYGPQNTAGGRAALSLLRGEARTYDAEMDERERLLNDASLRSVTLAPLTAVPKCFMSDSLKSPSLDYVLSLFAEYYGKESVTASIRGGT